MSNKKSSKEELIGLAQRADVTEQWLKKLQAQMDYMNTRAKLASIQAGSSNGPNKSELTQDQIEDLLLEYIDDHKTADSRDFGLKYNLTSNAVYGAISSLTGSEYVNNEQKSLTVLSLTKEGKEIISNGSPEYRLFNAIPNGSSISKNELSNKFGKNIFKVGFQKCMKNKWLIFKKEENCLEKHPDLKNINIKDTVAQQLREIQMNGIDSIKINEKKELQKRKLLKNETSKYYIITPGSKFARVRVKPIAKITPTHLKNNIDPETGEWNGPIMKSYNFSALGRKEEIGALHPLMKMRRGMRNILLEMGFEEMPTNQFVESSFMNFDTLFQPQQHPARDAHDTFFLSKPKYSEIENKLYMERVKKVHTKGGYGSIGWRYDWSINEAKKNLLRTHTTAVSSRMLYKLAQEKPFRPKKYFSIDRVFRNEAIDATHLAEFHQVEGFIADYNLTLGHLIGVIAEFFKKIGIPDVKFKPAYNPYTEPSMEIFGWSEERKKFVEVGNSGIFRPEMLEPMGLPKNVKVIAWGLGLERPIMIATKLGDIRQLFGPKVDVNFVKSFPFVRFDKLN